MRGTIVIIGGGFAGLAAACTAAHEGRRVILLEKNADTGGRARAFSKDGFEFDMGPSWYWMPEVFENFFRRFGRRVEDFYSLSRLDPSYRVFFEDGPPLDVPADVNQLAQLFETLEKGSGQQLFRFLQEARAKYEAAMHRFVWKPSLSILEYVDLSLLTEGLKLEMFSNMQDHLRRYFSHPKILKLLEFPVLFLGSTPQKTPALYSMMNYADIMLGTWYPAGGMVQVSRAMTRLAEELGVEIRTGIVVDRIVTSAGRTQGVIAHGEFIPADAVIGAADYHHIESKLLDEASRTYSQQYWEQRTMSPSSLIFFLGTNRKIDSLEHHNLFFDREFDQHAREIYDHPKWPSDPLFYVCCPSRTDPTVAPEGCENLFILIPVAPQLTSSEDERNAYLQICLDRMEQRTGDSIRDHIIFQRSYAHEEFIEDYNSFKGNAYGLANTLRQTAFLKPRLQSRKISNLFFAGQLTVPGPGVPPSIISGQMAAMQACKYVTPEVTEIIQSVT